MHRNSWPIYCWRSLKRKLFQKDFIQHWITDNKTTRTSAMNYDIWKPPYSILYRLFYREASFTITLAVDMKLYRLHENDLLQMVIIYKEMFLDCDWSISVQLISDRSAKICDNNAKMCNKSAKLFNNRRANQIWDWKTGMQIFLTKQTWRVKLACNCGQG